MKRKILSVLLILVLACSFGLVQAVPVQAADINVPDDYATIQEAVDAAQDFDTIIVADGIYSATTDNSILLEGEKLGYCFIHIDKPITLVGQSRDGVILDGTGLQGEVRSTGIWVSASDVMVKNLTIQNFTQTPEITEACYGLYVMEKFRHYKWDEVATLDSVTAENLKVVSSVCPIYFMKTEYAMVKDCVVDNNFGDGIWVSWGSHHATVQGNTVTNSGDHGIWVGSSWMGQGHSSNDATIIDNNINGAREGGISFVNSAGATISGNSITNAAGDGWSVGALSLKDGCSNVEAYDNTIYNNDGLWGGYSGTGHGVGIDGTPSNINLFLNNIYDNSGDGCHNYSTGAVNAKSNWWGDPSGPGGVGSGSGDEISTYVDFAPWLSGGPGAYAWIDTDLNSAFDLGEFHFTTIQAAIGSAISGNTISVTAGTYNENVVIPTEDLTLEGAQVGVDPTVGEARTDPAEESTIIGAVTIKASDIVVDGFRIEGTVYVDDSVSAIIDATISNNIITGASYGIRVGTASNKVISQLIIEYNEIIDNANKGICFWQVDWQAGNLHDVTIRDNTISGSSSSGISTYGAGPYIITGNTVSENAGNGISIKYDDGDVITGNIVKDNDAMGINMHQVTNCVVEDNTVSGHVNPEVVTTFWGDLTAVGKGSGIYVHEVSEGNTIRYNDITGNNNGVLINSEDGELPSGNSITYNNIAGNFYFGVLNALVDPPSPVDALYNYWGDETGPEHATLNPGAKGNIVSENVDFSPWLYEPQENFVSDAPIYAGSVVIGNEATLVEGTSYDGGWNSFSTPVTLDGSADSVSELLDLVKGSGLSILRAQRFNPISQGWDLLVMNDVVEVDYEDYEINPGEGFFIQVSTKGSLPILCSTTAASPPRTDLVAGWNLVGLSYFEGMTVKEALNIVEYSVVLSASPPNAESWSVPPDSDKSMELGEAYWLAMGQPGILFGYTTTPVAADMTWELN